MEDLAKGEAQPDRTLELKREPHKKRALLHPLFVFLRGFAPQCGSETPSFVVRKEITTQLRDLSGKTVYDLDLEDFEKLFCSRCHEYEECPRDDKKILGCKAFVDSGLWGKFYL